MKKLGFIVFSLIFLFAVSCDTFDPNEHGDSSYNETFLSYVGGFAVKEGGSFSADGKTLTDDPYTYTFVIACDGTSAIYKRDEAYYKVTVAIILGGGSILINRI